MNFRKKKLCAFTVALFSILSTYGDTSSYQLAPNNSLIPTNKLIDTPDYDCENLGVATFNVLDHGIDNSGKTDCTAAVQRLLDACGGVKTYSRGDSRNSAGGTLYFPAGTYLFTGQIIIPRGVSIRGDWNEQKDPMNVAKYPYTIRGNEDCYIVNVAFRAVYRGLDLFTNKCDRHYVDYLAGHAFANVVRIGGNSEDGAFTNCQFNTIVYACGDETKFGAWPNSLAMKDNTHQQQAYCQNERDLNFLIVGDCNREFLYNNFLFVCAKGMWFIADNNGGARDCRSLGNAVDGATQTFVFDGISSNLNLVNSQIVALDHAPEQSKHRQEVSDYIPAYFVKTGNTLSGKTITFFSSNLWGSGDYLTEINSGRVYFAMANMMNSGDVATFKTSQKSKINVFNAYFNNMKNTLATSGDGSRISITSSVIDFKGDKHPSTINWNYNLTRAWEFGSSSAIEDRTGWTATASPNDIFAMYAIDGNSATRWDTSSSQVGDEWVEINFNTSLIFNTVILGCSTSSNDGPAAYRVEALTNNGWQEVATGVNGGTMCIITFDNSVTATKVRVSQTGTKSNYWSINEFYVATIDIPLSSTDDSISDNHVEILIQNGSLVINNANEPINRVEIYDIYGKQVLSVINPDYNIDITELPSGFYIATVCGSSQTSVLKFAK